MVKSDKEAYKEDQDKYLPIVIQRNSNISGTVCVFGKTFDQIGKSICTQATASHFNLTINML